MTERSDLAAVRTAYDTVAEDYARLLADELAEKPFERAMLAAFSELVSDEPATLVADLGCGPGRISAHLLTLGLTPLGRDLSPGMIAVASRDHPGIEFAVASMAALDLTDGALGGIVAWYSIIHTDPDDLPALFEEFARVLATTAPLLLAFQAGDQREVLEHAYGHAISLEVHRHDPDRIASLLDRAGLDVKARLIREPEDRERLPQAFVLARKADRD